MPISPRPPRSLVALIALAMSLAVTTTGAATAHQVARPTAERTVRGAGAVQSAISPSAARPVVPERSSSLRSEHLAPRPATASPTTWTGRASTDTPTPSARSQSKAGSSGQGAGASAPFSGRNRVWIPALGIRRSVSFFSCSRSTYPGNRVYRWGCAGRNNVYLFGHAHSVFKPLHDAYVRGRLRKGMKAYFADGNGRVGTYKVIWWKVTTPDRGEFAYAAQSRPSMTLQTCVGARSQYRLVVRLVKVG
jgi:sortase (surface protein transpeptidase)